MRASWQLSHSRRCQRWGTTYKRSLQALYDKADVAVISQDALAAQDLLQ